LLKFGLFEYTVYPNGPEPNLVQYRRRNQRRSIPRSPLIKIDSLLADGRASFTKQLSD